MIASVGFRNFKVLRHATLPLGRFTLMVGPNGSGKTTALQGLEAVAARKDFDRGSRSAAVAEDEPIEVAVHWGSPHAGALTTARWDPTEAEFKRGHHLDGSDRPWGDPRASPLVSWLGGLKVYSLDAPSIALAVPLTPHAELAPSGAQLPAVLDRLRDQYPERFDSLNDELHRWLPEFDRVLFETPKQGTRALLLRTAHGGHRLAAAEISQGTLLALAILTLAYLPAPPTILGFEEPDRGIHPRLLRHVQDALYRLSHPESVGESRSPVQVIATTHSPYLLDLYRDHPEEIVVAQKRGADAWFERLSDRQDLHEILGDASLGEVWFTGVLGGVPSEE